MLMYELRMHVKVDVIKFFNLLRVDCNLISEIECLCVIYLMLNLLRGYCNVY